MTSRGLCSLIDQPTRITEATSSCIDHIHFRRSPRVKMDYTSWLINSDTYDDSSVNLELPLATKSSFKKYQAILTTLQNI